jgi:hypothetical protein
MESRPTELLHVESVKTSFVEPALVDPDLLDQKILFALLERSAVQEREAMKLFGPLVLFFEPACRLGHSLPAPIRTKNLR